MQTMYRRTLLKNIGHIAVTGTALSLLRPSPVFAEYPQQSSSPSQPSYNIDAIRKRIKELDEDDSRKYCMNMKAEIAKYYKTDAFNVIPCSNNDEVRNIISELHYIVIMYSGDLTDRPHMKPRIRGQLLRIHDNAKNYPEVQKTILDILVNHYKLV